MSERAAGSPRPRRPVLAARARRIFAILGAGVILVLLLLAPSVEGAQDEYVTWWIGDLSGGGLTPPRETRANAHIEMRWASGCEWPCDESRDTLFVEVHYDALEGEAEELRVRGTTPAGVPMESVLLYGGFDPGLHAVPRDAIQGSPSFHEATFVLTTSMHPEGEIGAIAFHEEHIRLCGWLDPPDIHGECWVFRPANGHWGWPLLRAPAVEERQSFVWVHGIVFPEDSRICRYYPDQLDVIAIEECPAEDLGWGIYGHDSSGDGCHSWRAAAGGRFRVDVPGAASGDSVRIWGTPWQCDSVCLFGPCIEVDSVVVLPDTLTPTRPMSWGQLKSRFLR